MNTIKNHPINKIKWGIIPIVNYGGRLLEKTKTGYKILGQEVSTPEEVDKVIEDVQDKMVKAYERGLELSNKT